MHFTDKDHSRVIAEELTKNGYTVKIGLLFYEIKREGIKNRVLCYSKTQFVNAANHCLGIIEHEEWLHVFSKTPTNARNREHE